MGFFDKIKVGLSKTRDALSSTLGGVFSGFSELDDDFYDELEERLILADLGVDTAVKTVDCLRKTAKERHLKTTDEAYPWAIMKRKKNTIGSLFSASFTQAVSTTTIPVITTNIPLVLTDLAHVQHSILRNIWT